MPAYRGLACLIVVVALPSAAWGQVSADDAFFESKIRPILVEHCYKCHSQLADSPKGGLSLDSRAGWQTGGDSGPAIIPGDPDNSLVIRAVRHADLKMPPDGKLPEQVIADLVNWVAMGAPDPRESPPQPSTNTAPLDGVTHWAFLPIVAHSPPAVANSTWPLVDVDYFLLAKLEAAGLAPVADADRYTWLRRVSLDLTGLPPTADEIQSFVADTEANAYEKVVDRLLASRAFGEKWGRHWLDLVGYADQIGTANDVFAEHAWRYRDYVIESFAAGRPFDQFIREQVAGDLLPFATDDQRAAQITATGFLVLGDLPIVEADKAKLEVDVVDQQVDKLGKAFLGLTIGCARCHDHKFDPVSQRDYYALGGIFNSTESVHRDARGIWSFVNSQELPESDGQRQARRDEHRRWEERLAQLHCDRSVAASRQRELARRVQEAEKDASQTAEAKAALANERDDAAGKVNTWDEQIEHATFFVPRPPTAFAVWDSAQPHDMRITIRGNAHALGDEVPRGFLQVLAGGASIEPGQSGRLQLADWLASPTNPLSSRVLVNRVWQKLFGVGLVASVDYFGVRGERPSHPELLDHLAAHFVTTDGWSQKRLIRRLVLSRAYRMSSQHDAANAAIDVENRLLWRMNRRRLEAESLRDCVLATSGKLVHSSGGPALPLEYVENTATLDPKNVNPPSFKFSKFRPEQPFQRTVYLPVIRSAPQAGPADVRNAFDFTQPAEFASQRAVTAVPTQALFLMNGPLVHEHAVETAQLAAGAASDAGARLEWLWLRILNRPITESERHEAAAFVSESCGASAGSANDESRHRAWAELCHALLISNEFLMRL